MRQSDMVTEKQVSSCVVVHEKWAYTWFSISQNRTNAAKISPLYVILWLFCCCCLYLFIFCVVVFNDKL